VLHGYFWLFFGEDLFEIKHHLRKGAIMLETLHLVNAKLANKLTFLQLVTD
jgi:hypothetical protein